jgi:hypothetical protein
MDIMDYAQEATYYVPSMDTDYAFVANINSIIEELGEVCNLAAKHENIRARIGASVLEFKPYHGWEDD